MSLVSPWKEDHGMKGAYLLWNALSGTVKRIWNPKSFKDHVAPHDFCQAVADVSNKKFNIFK